MVLVLACACSSKASAPALVWETDETHAFTRARAEHKAVALELWADWAMPCDEIDRALHSPAVTAALAPAFVPLKIDVSEDTDAIAALRARYNASSLPAVVFVATDGRVLGRVNVVVPEAELVTAVHAAAAKAR